MYNKIFIFVEKIHMEPEDTIDYNLRKTWYSIAKYYNRTVMNIWEV